MKLVLNDGKEILLDSVKTIQVHANEKLVVSISSNKSMTSYEKRKNYLIVKESFSSFFGIDCLVVENNITNISKIEVIKESKEIENKEVVIQQSGQKDVEKKEDKKEDKIIEKKEDTDDPVSKYLEKYLQDNLKKLLDNINKSDSSEDDENSSEKEEEKDEKSE